ncbi:MAG: hypothetical protein AAFU38_13330 [Bacteroidota bacterium]
MLASLPDSARSWFFTADRQLAPTERTDLLEILSPFLRKWQSHGRPVPAEATVLYDRFLTVGAHIEGEATNAGVSGCGIDAMTHAVMSAADAVGVAWVDGLQIAYEQPDGTPCVVSRRAFRALARDGNVDGATPVFVTTLATVGAVRSQGLRQPASEAWHGRTFRLTETA